MVLSVLNLEKLNSSEDEYLLSKLNHLVSKQEQNKEKEKDKEQTNKTSIKKPTIVVTKQTLNSQIIQTTHQAIISPPQESLDLKLPELRSPTNILESTSEIKCKKVANSLSRVNEIITKTQNRFKLKTTTKELKFNEKIKDFAKLDTFFNVKGLLHQINLTNEINLKTPKHTSLYEKMNNLGEEPNESVVLEEDLDEEEIKTQNLFSTHKKGINTQKFKKKSEEHIVLTDEIIDKKLQLCNTMTNYLKKSMRREFDFGFEKQILEDFEKNDFKLVQQNKRNAKYSISQEMELKNLEKFVLHKVRENQLKSELKNGFYLEKYRNQASKIIEILHKTSKSIYSKKVKKINENLIEKNKIIMKKKKEKIQIINSPIIEMEGIVQKPDRSKTIHKSIVFLTEQTPSIMAISNEKTFKSTRNHHRVSSLENFIPIIKVNLHEKMQVGNMKKWVFQKNKLDHQALNVKIEEFIKECDATKYKNFIENDEDLREIDKVQNIIDKGLESLKGTASRLDGLRMTIDKNTMFRKPLKKRMRGSSHVSIGSIVGLI